MTRRRTILIGMAAGLLWAVLVVLFGRHATVGFVPLPIVVPVATVLPGLVLAAMIGRIAQRRFFDDALIDGDRPAADSGAEIDRRVLLNTVEQCVLALLLWPFVAYTLGGSLVLVMSAAFAIARIAFWIGYHISPPIRAFGFAATFYTTVLAALWALVGWFV